VPARAPSALIVEDNPDLRYIFRVSLSVAGFDVREASDGYMALVALEEAPPDVLVLDLGLPRVSGVSVLEEVAARVDIRGVAVVVVTGLDLEPDTDARILRKPVEPGELVAAVRQALRRAAAASHP